MILEAIVATVVGFTGGTCAGHDNAQDKAVWGSPRAGVTTTHYDDRGEWLVYADAPGRKQNREWLALHLNERAMTYGKPGRKVRVSCVWK